MLFKAIYIQISSLKKYMLDQAYDMTVVLLNIHSKNMKWEPYRVQTENDNQLLIINIYFNLTIKN
jgi:hypothetical protein